MGDDLSKTTIHRMVEFRHLKIRCKMNKAKLAREFGQTYSSLLKINLNGCREKEIFKWFLAALLFGKPIREETAIKTYKLFMAENINNADKVIAAGWRKLVKLLDLGGYARYDFSTATKLLEIMGRLKKDYGGLVSNIHKDAKDSKDLEKRLLAFKGIGPVTVNIFLRELRAIWKKADPQPLPHIKELAKKLKINLGKLNRKSKRFIRLECALHRIWR